MPARAKSAKVLRLGEESWGDRLHRAYRIQRDLSGGRDIYKRVAERVSQVHPTNATSIQRLEEHDDVPKQPRTRLLAYLTILAYGFNPEDFGLTKDNVPLAGYDPKRLSDLLISRTACISVDAA